MEGTIDVHGKTVLEAKKMIKDYIVSNKKCIKLNVIHGYNNGNKIKAFLKDKEHIGNPRVIRTRDDLLNSGITIIDIRPTR